MRQDRERLFLCIYIIGRLRILEKIVCAYKICIFIKVTYQPEKHEL